MVLEIQCPPTYPPGCKIVFCGEAPGEEELHFKEGFSGKSGKLLDKAMLAAGISRSEVGLTNVCKRAPNGGFDNEHFKTTFYNHTRRGKMRLVAPTPELLDWIDLLRRELLQQKPNVVVACGQEALSALCSVVGITKYRGSILDSTLVPGLKVVPILHPSFVLRKAQWQELYITSRILRTKVRPESEFAELRRVGWASLVAPSLEQIKEWIGECEKDGGSWTLDIELRGNALACVGLAYGKLGSEKAICVPLQITTGSYFTPQEEAEWWASLQWLMLNNQNGPIGHNIVCDLGWLSRYGVRPYNAEDTMLLFHRLYAELPKKLSFCNMLYTDIPYYKDDGKTWGQAEPDEKLWFYNIKDAIATLRVWYALQNDPEAQLTKTSRVLYESLARPLIPIAIEMQNTGLEADETGVALARAVATVELAKVRKRLDELTAGELVVREGNSKITDQQIMNFLYRKLKLPIKRKFITKSETADEDAIVELIIGELVKRTSPHLETLRCALADRKFFKVLTSYINIDWALEPVVMPWKGVA